MRISAVIPTYEMNGDGVKFLKRSLDILEKQTFKDFEVVISDNSDNDDIANIIKEYKYSLDIRYHRNPMKGMATNTNRAMQLAEGEIIKILYMDDYLHGINSLKKIDAAFTDDVNWLATGCIHFDGGALVRPHYPSYSHDIYTGNNTIGSPSVVSIRNKDLEFFDEKMTWVLDCDLYSRLYKKHGEPELLYDLNVVMGLHKNQTTNLLAEEVKRAEVNYMLNKNL